MPKPCPSCAEPVSGRFCPHCGVAVEATCRECNHELPPGARFCNECGTPVAAAVPRAASESPVDTEPAPRPASSNLPWIITAAALVALIGVVLLPRFQEDEADVFAPPITAPTGAELAGARAVDLSSMTPREAADRLFNRVMQNVSAGDSVEARRFLPMALAAYDRVEGLDADGRYHLAVLHFVGNDPAAAREQAEAILSADPNHLFGLFTAAQAEQTLGNRERARELYRQFLDRYDAEMARALPEYSEHSPVLPSMREEAERIISAG